MSDTRRTQPLDRDEVVLERDATHSDGGVDRTDPVAAVRNPETGAKLLLGIAAVTLLNFILLLFLLARAGGGPTTIMVQGQPCVIADHEGTDTLFCAQTANQNGSG